MDESRGPVNGSAVARSAGVNFKRERIWGLVGGAVGVLVGVGLSLEAVIVEHSGWYAGNSFPPFFTTRRLLAYDACLLTLVMAGAAFSVAAVIYARFGRHPRTDATGAALLGLVLSALGGVILFMRVYALTQGG